MSSFETNRRGSVTGWSGFGGQLILCGFRAADCRGAAVGRHLGGLFPLDLAIDLLLKPTHLLLQLTNEINHGLTDAVGGKIIERSVRGEKRG